MSILLGPIFYRDINERGHNSRQVAVGFSTDAIIISLCRRGRGGDEERWHGRGKVFHTKIFVPFMDELNIEGTKNFSTKKLLINGSKLLLRRNFPIPE